VPQAAIWTAFTRLNTSLRGRPERGFQQSAARNPLLQGLRNGARLLVDLLEHEVPVLTPFDGVGRQLAFAHRRVDRLPLACRRW
jgi:hypothetical protein